MTPEILTLAAALLAAVTSGVLAVLSLLSPAKYAAVSRWLKGRHDAAVYHRQRYGRAKCHAKANATHRLSLLAHHVLTVRLRALPAPAEPSALAIPDPAPFVRAA